MCERITQTYTWAQLHAALDVLGPSQDLQPRYNIAPTSIINVVVMGETGREVVPMRWGFIPRWWKKAGKDIPATFNAAAESVVDKPMFRHAFKECRCIIPASGFYMWTEEHGEQQPHLFTAADGSPILTFAGLWDHWRDPATNETVLSCTMIVSGASAWMEPFHDRMPALLEEKDFDAWLVGTLGSEALKPAPAEALREWPVSRRVNFASAGDDDPTLIEPANSLTAGAP